MKLYVVCMDSHWIRDAQMFDTKELNDEQFSDLDPFSDENTDRWYDIDPSVFIDMIMAESEEIACRMIAVKHRYDYRQLYAFPAEVKEVASV